MSSEALPLFEEVSAIPPASVPSWHEEAYPALESAAAARERAVALLSQVDPALTEQLPQELPFTPVDDPFTRTYDEWEQVWYATRESAMRVFLNMRMEFRRQLTQAMNGESHDLKPWTRWAFHGVRPAEGEPVHGLSSERLEELGWTYPGPATDFRIYRDQDEAEAAAVS